MTCQAGALAAPRRTPEAPSGSPGDKSPRTLGGTLLSVTTASEFADLHRLVDRLTRVQAKAVRALMLEFVADQEPVSEPIEALLADEPVRSFSFAGRMHAGPDLAEQDKEIVRAEFRKVAE